MKFHKLTTNTNSLQIKNAGVKQLLLFTLCIQLSSQSIAQAYLECLNYQAKTYPLNPLNPASSIRVSEVEVEEPYKSTEWANKGFLGVSSTQEVVNWVTVTRTNYWNTSNETITIYGMDPDGTDQSIRLNSSSSINLKKRIVIHKSFDEQEFRKATSTYYYYKIGDKYVSEIRQTQNPTAKRLNNNKIEVNSYTNSSDIIVKKGDKIYIHASGSIVTGAWSGDCGPSGRQYSNLWNIVPNIYYGALLVKVGDAPWHATEVNSVYTAPNSGKLKFAVNDTDPSDNSGSFIVEYKINKPFPDTPNPPNTTSESISRKSQDPKSNSITTTRNSTLSSVKTVIPVSSKPDYNVKPYLPKIYRGYMTNTTFNKSAICENELSLNDDGSYVLSGNVDDVNLFGSWYLTGHEVTKNGKKCIKFVGKLTTEVPTPIEVNNRPVYRKKKVPMTWLVEITESGMNGSYEIAAFEQVNQIQYGIVDLH